MIDEQKILAVIPARGGSKGVPRKNIRPLAGKPLIGWTIDAAHDSRWVDKVITSTDDDEIAAIARSLGCDVPFMRPAHLAADHSPGAAPVLHALEALPGYDYVVLLQPTSPLRTKLDIDACIERCSRLEADSCVSVTEIDQSPFWMFTMAADGKMRPFLTDEYLKGRQRQHLPRMLVLNGAVYVVQVEKFMSEKTFFFENTVGYEMPADRSLDIDKLWDFEIAEFVLQRKADF